MPKVGLKNRTKKDIKAQKMKATKITCQWRLMLIMIT
jgi:hypothetical protein